MRIVRHPRVTRPNMTPPGDHATILRRLFGVDAYGRAADPEAGTDRTPWGMVDDPPKINSQIYIARSFIDQQENPGVDTGLPVYGVDCTKLRREFQYQGQHLPYNNVVGTANYSPLAGKYKTSGRQYRSRRSGTHTWFRLEEDGTWTWLDVTNAPILGINHCLGVQQFGENDSYYRARSLLGTQTNLVNFGPGGIHPVTAPRYGTHCCNGCQGPCCGTYNATEVDVKIDTTVVADLWPNWPVCDLTQQYLGNQLAWNSAFDGVHRLEGGWTCNFPNATPSCDFPNALWNCLPYTYNGPTALHPDLFLFGKTFQPVPMPGPFPWIPCGEKTVDCAPCPQNPPFYTTTWYGENRFTSVNLYLYLTCTWQLIMGVHFTWTWHPNAVWPCPTNCAPQPPWWNCFGGSFVSLEHAYDLECLHFHEKTGEYTLGYKGPMDLWQDPDRSQTPPPGCEILAPVAAFPYDYDPLECEMKIEVKYRFRTHDCRQVQYGEADPGIPSYSGALAAPR